MKIIYGLLMLWTLNAWASMPLPDLRNGDSPVVGKYYSFITSYAGAHRISCPEGTCVAMFRGQLPNSAADSPVNSRTGSVMCTTCRPGIYQFDQYHYVFVYGTAY